MKKRMTALFIAIAILCTLLPATLLTAIAEIDWGTRVYISGSGQVVDSITFNGKTVNAIYTPRSSISDYDSDTTYCCAAFVKRFYSTVFGVTVDNLIPGNTPHATSGSFSRTTTPQVGDIAGSSEHWAIVKAVNGNAVTLIEQNAWSKDHTCAMVGRVLRSESSYWFWHWSGYYNNNDGSQTTVSWTEETCTPTQTDAYISLKAVPNTSGSYGECGVTLMDANGNTIGSKTEMAPSSAISYLKIWYYITDELGVVLTPGATYKYQMYTYFNNVRYDSPVITFTTLHTHSYDAVVTAPTCTEDGYTTHTCGICGDSYTDTYTAATGHSYTAVVTAPTCTVDGYTTYTCSCGDSYTAETVSATGHTFENGICTACGVSESSANCTHDYVAETVPPTCVEAGYIRYTCSKCGDTYNVYPEEEYSEWSETPPQDVPADRIQSRTEYRYSDYETGTGGFVPEGWEQTGKSWIQTGSGTVDYVKFWPSGYNTSHSTYSAYHKTPESASQTETEKVTVISDSVCGYLYWHWCRGQTPSGGPTDRIISDCYETAYPAFAAFFSDTMIGSLEHTGNEPIAYKFARADVCADSYWYFAVPVYHQIWETKAARYTYARWTDWSQWSETEAVETEERQVETRTVYRYVAGLPGEHQWGEWETVAPATCTEDGTRERVCALCNTTEEEPIPAAHTWDAEGLNCTICDAVNPDYVPLAVRVSTVTAAPGETVTVPVTIENNTGFAGFTFTITCDEGLTLTGISKGALLNTSESGAFTKNVESRQLTWADSESISGDGTLFTLTLTLADNAEPGLHGVSVRLKDNEPTNFVDRDAEAVPLRFVAGGVDSNHTHSYTEETTPASCTEDGVTVYTCICGATYSEVLPKLDHNIVATAAAVPATCTESGLTEAVRCTRCDYETAQTVIPPLGHDYIETVLMAPTCTKEGASEFSCSRCDYYNATFTPALDHDYIEEVLIAPTCTKEGASEFSCSRCDYYEAKFTPALGHDYVVTSETPATCTSDGSRVSTCSRCPETQTEVLPKTGHSYEMTEETPATCETDGSKTYVCSKCDDTYTDTIPALGHDYEGRVLIAPTCVKQGLIKYTCTRPGCGSTYSEKLDPAHSYGTPVDNGDGTHTLTCTVCPYSETESHIFADGVCACGALDPNAQQIQIKSAALRLNRDIDILFTVEIPDGYTNPYLVFSYLDEEYTISDYMVNDEGQCCFNFGKVNPQCMGDSITATLHATFDGKEYTDTVADYSVREYCVNQLAKTDDAKLITLLSDILAYGAAAQVYTGYKTDELVTEDLDLTPSTFEALSGKAVSFTGEQDENTCWTGASLVLSNDLAMRFTFVTDSTDGLTVEVAIDGRTQTFDTFEDAGNGRYCITFDGIMATEFDDTVTATFYRNGEQIGAAVNYSVNTYICSTQNVENANLQALVRALYNYGASAKAYADTNK